VDFSSSKVTVGEFNAVSSDLTLTSDSKLETNNLYTIDTTLKIFDPTTPTIISKVKTKIENTELIIENKDGSWEGKSYPIISFSAADEELIIQFSSVDLISKGTKVTNSGKRECQTVTHQIEDSPTSDGLTTRSVVFSYSDCEPVDNEGTTPGDVVLIVVGVLAIIAILIGIIAVIVYYQSKKKPAIGAEGYYSNL
jgi:hypothetical protein